MTDAFRSIYFDCDSTLATIEGIDALAADAPAEIRDRITGLTDEAMDGKVPMDSIYGQRLELIRPGRAAIDAIGDAYIQNLVPDTTDVIAALHSLGKRVGIISGGLLPAVRVLADHLGVDPALVHAVDLYFDDAGAYAGFDERSPLARNGGKPELLATLEADARPVAFIGDGVTDLEAAPTVDRFIGFGGVARRDKVVAGAEFFADGPGLDSVLEFCTTPAERQTLRGDSRFVHLIEEATP